jgi:hypothetical protein
LGGAFDPAVAAHPDLGQFLVVWSGTDNTGSLVAGEGEIFDQRLDAATGLQLGPNDVRLSRMGPDGAAGYSALYPAVVYNHAAGEYLVAWSADHNALGLIDQECEVFGQRLHALYPLHFPPISR